MKEVFPHLEWMRSLQSLAIVKRCHDDFTYYDPLGEELISWLFCKNKYENGLSLPTSLERIWLDAELSYPRISENDLPGSTIKSIILENLGPQKLKLDRERFRQMEHLNEIDFSEGHSHLPHLKYVQGQTSSNKVHYVDLVSSVISSTKFIFFSFLFYVIRVRKSFLSLTQCWSTWTYIIRQTRKLLLLENGGLFPSKAYSTAARVQRHVSLFLSKTIKDIDRFFRGVAHSFPG